MTRVLRAASMTSLVITSSSLILRMQGSSVPTMGTSSRVWSACLISLGRSEVQPDTGGRGVDRLLTRPEADVTFREGVQLVDEVPDRPAEKIRPRHDERVSWPDLVEELVEFRAVLERPGHGVDEHPLAARLV
jgi:hypothetical protein